jgi:hypothetical protein
MFASSRALGRGALASLCEQAHPGDPLGQIRAWLADVADHVANANHRGCALANAAVELPDKTHPARRVIEEYKIAQRGRLARLCRDAGLNEPELLADELLFVVGRRAGNRAERRDGRPWCEVDAYG